MPIRFACASCGLPSAPIRMTPSAPAQAVTVDVERPLVRIVLVSTRPRAHPGSGPKTPSSPMSCRAFSMYD